MLAAPASHRGVLPRDCGLRADCRETREAAKRDAAQERACKKTEGSKGSGIGLPTLPLKPRQCTGSTCNCAGSSGGCRMTMPALTPSIVNVAASSRASSPSRNMTLSRASPSTWTGTSPSRTEHGSRGGRVLLTQAELAHRKARCRTAAPTPRMRPRVGGASVSPVTRLVSGRCRSSGCCRFRRQCRRR